MSDLSHSFTDLLIKDTTPQADLLRFCWSDKLPVSIHQVFDDELTPAEYAGKLLKLCNFELAGKFFLRQASLPFLPSPLYKSWLFDTMIACAMTARVMQVRPEGGQAVHELVTPAKPNLLAIHDFPHSGGAFSGLAHFSTDSTDYYQQSKTFVQIMDLSLFLQLIEQVGCITEPTWVLYHPIWGKLLQTQSSLLKAFRSFLYVVLASTRLDKDSLEGTFEVAHEDIRFFMEWFVDLRTTDAAKEDVSLFLQRLTLYFDNVSPNTFMMSLIKGPFEFFKAVHTQQFHRFQRLPVGTSNKPD